MRKILIIVLSCTFLAACGNNQRDKVDEHIRDIVNNYDWSKGVPLYPMIDAYHECEKYPDISWCLKLHNQLIDISASYESCKLQSPQSMLCGVVVNKIKDNPIKSVLPTAEALSLPDNPFYFSLPTKLLEENASGNGYRSEMLDLWMQKYQLPLYKIIRGTMTALVLWLFFIFCRGEKANHEKIERNRIADEQEAVKQKARDDKLNEQKAVAAEKLKISEEEAAQKQNADAQIIAAKNRKREAELIEHELRKAEEKQKVQEAEAREAADKKQIEDMIKAAVKNLPKKK